MSPVVEYRYSNDEPTWGHTYLWPVVRRIVERQAPPPRRVFELGCGNGAMARMLSSLGYDVTAVDPSASGIAVARQHESERLRFDVASTEDDLAGRFGRVDSPPGRRRTGRLEAGVARVAGDMSPRNRGPESVARYAGSFHEAHRSPG